MEELILIEVLTRLIKWILRSIFRMFVTIVLVGFFVWLFVVEMGYGEIIEEYVMEILRLFYEILTANS